MENDTFAKRNEVAIAPEPKQTLCNVSCLFSRFKIQLILLCFGGAPAFLFIQQTVVAIKPSLLCDENQTRSRLLQNQFAILLSYFRQDDSVRSPSGKRVWEAS